MEWIHIDDRKPLTPHVANGACTSDPVLVVTANGYMGRCVYEQALNDDTEWWYEIGIDTVDDVRYWMPCPELPKDVANKSNP
jgi:hypothetical protein